MRQVTQVRHLAQQERIIALSVFKHTIPYDKILVSDGLGGGDRPFTLPTSLPVSPLFNVTTAGKYVLHVGDGYHGMSTFPEDQKTLIHELAHVWQGEHEAHSWTYVVSSIWGQTLSGDAYTYDKTRLDEDWNNYNAEQQAQIVEDWFENGRKADRNEDLRFYYIKKHIWGERVDSNWIRESRALRPLEASTLKVPPSHPSVDAYVVPLLEQRFRANDLVGALARANMVEEAFRKLEPLVARQLLPRLQSRRHGDKLSELFHDHLSTATRLNLQGVVRGRQ